MMRLRSIAGPLQHGAQERRAGRARALGVKLRAGHAPVADEAREPAASTSVEVCASVVGRGSVAGAQFHPERSGAAGAAFLRAVLAWAGDAA